MPPRLRRTRTALIARRTFGETRPARWRAKDIDACMDTINRFRLSMQRPVSRGMGHAATAAAAYRAGLRIEDERTGEVYDYTRKSGIEHAELVTPAGVDRWSDRANFWNDVERANRRADSIVAREIQVNIPHELPPDARRELVRKFAQSIADKYQVVVDTAIHKPHGRVKNLERPAADDHVKADPRNVHAHLLISANHVSNAGVGKKCRDLDPIAQQRARTENDAEPLRKEWCDRCNEYLGRHYGSLGRPDEFAPLDHRSYKRRGLDRQPTKHLGRSATAMERRGIRTRVGDMNRSICAAYEFGVLERAAKKIDSRIIDMETSLDQALKQRGHPATERSDEMKAVGEFIADTADVIGKTAGGVLLESIGGGAATPQQPSFRIEQPPSLDYAKDRERLENSTGKPHYYVSGQVEGRLLGKANLGGEAFARISHQQGKAVALVPWREEMTRHIGKELTVSHDKGRDMTIQVGGARDLGRSL